MINCILVPTMRDIGIIFNKFNNFYYDREEYLRDKIIIDLPVEFIEDEKYKSYCTFLSNKGFNILFKGVIKALDFGFPTTTRRCVIVCSRNTNNPLYKFIVNNGKGFVTPFELLHGKLSITVLKNTLKKCYPEFSSVDINEIVNSYLINNYDRSVLRDFIDNACDLDNRKDFKFSDGSNDLPKGNRKKIKDSINDIRDYPLSVIMANNDMCYIHWLPKRDYMTVREIARLNGYDDSIDLSGVSREYMIELVNNSLSPYIVKRLWEALY